MRARLALGCVCVVSLALLAPAPAGADVFSPISLVSYGAVGGGFVQQAEYAHDAAISADGEYVAFDGSVGGVTGVWRRDLETKTIEQVAGGDAAMPSISEEGRYVSFTTDEGASLPEVTHAQPDAEPHREAVQVYRRDMDVEPAATSAEETLRAPSERAFLAASVPSGSLEPLRYANAGESGGSYAVGRTAMSANGNEVAFVTTAVSNLVAYPALEEGERGLGETPAPHTPAGQVAVHDYETGVTELVSRCRFECVQGPVEPVAAVEEGGKPVGAVAIGAADFPAHEPHGSWPGASISADGTTVAWLGEDIAQQAPTLAHEDLEALYEEPLWRRLPASANQTRRVTGGSDPEDPACAGSGELELAPYSENASDPCQGPFVREQANSAGGQGLIKNPNHDDDTPRLSRNGEKVVFGANARLLAQGADFDRSDDVGNPTDLFLVSMQPGLTRTQALTTLTETGSSEAEDEAITDWEISPDGEQVAFTTARTTFTLGQPTLITPPLGEVGISELYDADLANGTLTRVTHGYEGEGEPSEQPHRAPTSQGGDPYKEGVGYVADELGALTPDFSGDGDELVFTSTAANLVYGDGNSPAVPVACCQAGDGSDVFLVTRKQFAEEPTPQQISPAPEPPLAPPWSLGVTARSRPNGSVLLYVQAPGAGTIKAGARGAVVVKPAKAKTKPRGAAKAVATRALATRAAEAKEAGMTTLTLTLAPRYAALARTRGGLSATVTVTFAAPGRPVLREGIPVTFVRTIDRSQKKKQARARKARGRSSKSGGRR